MAAFALAPIHPILLEKIVTKVPLPLFILTDYFSLSGGVISVSSRRAGIWRSSSEPAGILGSAWMRI